MTARPARHDAPARSPFTGQYVHELLGLALSAPGPRPVFDDDRWDLRGAQGAPIQVNPGELDWDFTEIRDRSGGFWSASSWSRSAHRTMSGSPACPGPAGTAVPAHLRPATVLRGRLAALAGRQRSPAAGRGDAGALRPVAAPAPRRGCRGQQHVERGDGDQGPCPLHRAFHR